MKARLKQLFADGDRLTDISVVGERSTGTNYCAFLIRKNFGFSGQSHQGWKHGFLQTPAITRDHLFIICTRNAIDWVKGVYAKPWHCPPHMYQDGFSRFIRNPWETICDRPGSFSGLAAQEGLKDRPLLPDRDPLDGSVFANIVKLRNAKHRSFLGFKERQINSVVVQLEFFQTHPEDFVKSLASLYDLPRASEIVTQSPRQMGSRGPFGDTEARRAETASIAETDKDFILGELDHCIEADLGYSY